MFKKSLIIIMLTALLTVLCSCEVEESSSSSVDYQTEFSSMSQLAEYIIEEGNNDENVSFNNAEIYNTSSNGVTLYEPDYLPSEFSLHNISLTDSYIYYSYYTDELKEAKENHTANSDMEIEHTISFTWAIGFDGQESLQTCIDKFNLIELSNMPSYYYAFSSDHAYIYWCEDDYRFSIRIPTSVGTVNPETHEYSGEDVFALKKTFYPFEENEVVE